MEKFSFLLEEETEKKEEKYNFSPQIDLGIGAETTGGISLPETPEIKPLMEGLPISKPEDKPEPTWGEVIKQSLKAGLGQYQASLVNVLRLIQTGAVKATDAITNIFDPNWYDPNKDILLKSLTKIVEDSEKIAVKSAEQAESKQWLKKLVGTGLQATPQILGAAIMGTAMPVAGGIAAAKPTAEIATRVSQMIPFGVGAAGGHAREIEKEYEALGKEAPYLKMVAGGLLGGAGEMATELPVFLGVTRLLKTGGKELINEGAKTLISKYGKLGIEFIKNIGLQAWQEAEMEPIQNAIVRAIGLPQEKIIDIKEMGQAAYGGIAMALVLGGLGGGIAGSAKVAEKTGQAVDDFIQNKGDIRETLRVIAEAQGIIPREPEAVALGYKEEEKEIIEPLKPTTEKVAEVKAEEIPKDVKIRDVYNIGENITQAKVKPLVRKTTGQTKESRSDKLLAYESDIVKYALAGQEKASKEAFKAGKVEGIFTTKEHYEDVLARAKVRKYQKDYINKLTSDISKLPTQNMAVDYKEMIESIKGEFDLKKRTGKTIARRIRLANYIEKQAELDHEVDIPQDQIDLIRKKPLNDMTIEELETVHDNIMHLAHLGKTKNKLLKIAEKRNINNQIDTLVDTITKGEGITVKDVIKTGREDKTFFQKIGEAGQTYHYNTIRAERLFEQADNYKDSGEFWTTFFKPINEATYEEQDNYNIKLDEFRGFINDNNINIGKFLADKQEINDRVTLTSTEKVEVFLATFDKDKMRHLIRGNNFTEKDITDVVNSLTPEEKAMGEYLVKHYDEQYKGINEIYKKLAGKNLPKIPGYSPIRLLSETIDTTRDVIESLLTKYNVRPSIRKGFTKERTKGAIQPLNLDAVNNLMFNLSRVEHYKAFVLPIRDINKLLSNPKLIEAIKQKRGNPFYQNLKSWLLDVSDTNPGISFDQVDKIARLLRVRAADAMLGFNIVSALKQPISVLNACGEIGVFNVLNGIQQLSKSPVATTRIVYEKSPLVRNRKGQFDRVISELEQSKNIKQIIKQTKTKSDIIIGLIKFMDQQSVKAVWKGAYDQALGKDMTDQEAIDYADKVIRKTQPMAGVKDLARWFRGGTLSKMFTMFQNQINNNYNYYTHDIIGKYRAGEIGVGKVMYRVAFSYAMPALLMGMITRGRLPEEPKEALKDLISFPVAGFFFVGSIVKSMIDGWDEFSIPPLSWANDILKVGTTKTLPTKIKYSLSALSKVLGIPWNQPYRTVKGMMDYLGGNTDDLRRLVYSESALGAKKKGTEPVTIDFSKISGEAFNFNKPKFQESRGEKFNF